MTEDYIQELRKEIRIMNDRLKALDYYSKEFYELKMRVLELHMACDKFKTEHKRSYLRIVK